MIILVRGGEIAYDGPRKYVIDYFASHGCVVDATIPNLNRTDFLIDITSKPPPFVDKGDELLVESVALSTNKPTWATLWGETGQVSSTNVLLLV
jgi:hypothetical protein